MEMVDDMIHDKYERNTNEYYEYRNARDESLLKKGGKNLSKSILDAYFQEPHEKDPLLLYDNLAVGYEHIGQYEKAVSIYQTKKQILDSRPFDQMNRYRYYANLGTFSIHKGLKTWMKNPSDFLAKQEVIDGRNMIAKAIEINVDAHFGRENYQLIANDWIISSFTNSWVMQTENLLGKKALDTSLLTWGQSVSSCWERYVDIYPKAKRKGKAHEEQVADACPMALAGVMGMIRYWGGPNPYSYETIGDILVSMGEDRLAFAAYARALKMKHPNALAIKDYMLKLVPLIDKNIAPKPAFDARFAQFEADYTLGSAWSQAYQDFQKEMILKGGNPLEIGEYQEFYTVNKHAGAVKYERKEKMY